MIDTDKYEGHTPVRKEWPRWCEDWLFSVYADDGSHIPNWNQDNNLACDAPLLLAEVKRLREERKQIRELLAEVLPRKDGVPHIGTILWGLESELKSTTSEIAIILGMAEREEE